MDFNTIRDTYLQFFKSKGHTIVGSGPMVIKNDPTLMFTNAGMNQFKDFFLGYNDPKDKRVTNTQKCLRVSGKHNDLEEVGVDTYHHTMFEMLGNWSFGDYFKEDSIAWAWELLTEVYKIDIDRLYVTVFEGDKSDGTDPDNEAREIWKKFIAEDRIISSNKKDNFWEMGETGPCGPSSEIHVDIRSEEERKQVDGKSLVNQDHPQVIEIWNLVFMQYNRKADGSLEKLPTTHVDTGMGLERLAMVIQGKKSNYDTDLFQHLIQFLTKEAGIEYGKNEATDIALRVISDHIRAIAFSITDGQLPSNTGAGYVIRRILRRAVRYGYQTLNLNEPFLFKMVNELASVMGQAFPELIKQKELIAKVIFEEEQSFFNTLEKGLKRIDLLIEHTKKEGGKSLNGEAVFELHDTFGFPPDLTSLIASENGLTIDQIGFDQELEKQKNRSRQATQIESDDWVILREDDVEEFIGYDFTESDVYISKYRKVKQKNKSFYQLVFTLTPFYAEGGGQVGDTGVLLNDDEKIAIFDTKKENNLIVHYAKELPKNASRRFKAIVNVERRKRIAANHSATHLLHYVLRDVLGDHVEQKGSLVNEKNLRFDFSHFAKVEKEQLKEIEQRVNGLIRDGVSLNERRSVPIEVANEMGAMALFGEKYGDVVRVIQFGDSVELCGGIHVQNTIDIRFIKLVSEGSVASGIRRIEAITGDEALSFYTNRVDEYEEIASLLKQPKSVPKAVEDLLSKQQKLQKEVEALKKNQLLIVKNELKGKVVSENGVNYLDAILDLDAGSIKDLCFQLRGEIDNLFCVIGGKSDDKASLSIIINEQLAKTNDWHAGNMVKSTAPLIKGGGGGQPFFAMAGGKDASGLTEAIDAVHALIKS
jgi:alanyl-tRNA synthetase